MSVKKVVATLFAGALLLAGSALAKDFQEGVQYVPIQPLPPVSSGDEVEVIEFFWYGCPHCRDFEPGNVKFSQIPVMFGGPADMHAQVYYALQGMGELERLHEKLFKAMHVDGRKLRTRDEVDAFLAENGVDMTKFAEAMNSFAVAAKVNRARASLRRSRRSRAGDRWSLSQRNRLRQLRRDD